MKHLSISLVLFVVAAVHAKQKNTSEDGFEIFDTENKDKPSEKRGIQQPPSAFTKSPETDSVTGNQERAKEEKTIKDFFPYDTLQSVLINRLKVLSPKPIVDTAEESEKLAPNYGGNVQFLGDLVVKGSETLSKAILSVFETPRHAISKVTSKATEALSQLGAYISGI